MTLVLMNNAYCLSASDTPEYLVSDADFIKLLNSKEARQSLAQNNVIKIGRLGKTIQKGLFNLKEQVTDLSSVEYKKEVGYYAKLSRIV